ncbi:MAG: hypothetical protein K0R89_1376 [Ramlibacter sp.]|nr:hypothetical protein [Ramlibacter sp.]
MQQQIEQWDLGSGTWQRDRAAEAWRLVAGPSGATVSSTIALDDLVRLVGARRDPAGGRWLPPDFRFSPRTGAPLQAPDTRADASWVPPFGASTQPGSQHASRGLRRTPAALALARAPGRTASSKPDRTLPLLPQGRYQFVVDSFDVTCPNLLAIEPDEGRLFVLLPHSQQWIPLECPTGPGWGHRLPNPRGWRMEVLHADGHATLYCPSATGLVVITPSVLGLRCSIEQAGHGPALGGPVAWNGEIWTPTHGKDDMVHLIGKRADAAGRAYTVLPTQVPVPPQGFEAPVFDDHHVTWLSDHGQLVLRGDANGGMRTEWVAWPEDVKPVFAVGCPYLHDDGSFWQLCRRNAESGVAFVQVAGVGAPRPMQQVNAASVSTGGVSYRGTARFADAPWTAQGEEASVEVVLPLLESARDGAVLGLRMDAPRGVPALVQGGHEPKRAILQVELPGQAAVSFGGIAVKRPWLALPFVHDGHLWIHHPEMPQVPGWKLDA